MISFRIVLYGNPITKKNNQQIFKSRNGRRFISQSEQYKAYEEACLMQIDGVCRKRIEEPVNLKCVYYMPDLRKVDLTNLLSATNDILVKAGVLSDDNSRIVVSMDGSRVYVDRNKPRVEIEIIPFEFIQKEV